MFDAATVGTNAALSAKRVAKAIFGGRYALSAWAVESLIYVAAVGLLCVPLVTFIWTTPRPLRELYPLLVLGATLWALAGMLLAYSKRLQDQNRSGIWSLLVLVALPWGLLSGAEWWADQQNKQHHDVSFGAFYSMALALFAVIALAIALLPAKDSDRFGPRLEARSIVRFPRPGIVLAIGSVVITIVVSLYAAYFQDGIWVGREQLSYYMGPSVNAPGGGTAFATCANAKGVSAHLEGGDGNSFARDKVGGAWAVVELPDGTLDIQTFNDRQVYSYRDDGFTVSAKGLQLTDDGHVASGVDHFTIVAQSESGTGADNITVMNFVAGPSSLDTKALISSSRIVPKGGLLTLARPWASTYLLMADCELLRS